MILVYRFFGDGSSVVSPEDSHFRDHKILRPAEENISGGLPPAREGPAAKPWEVPEEIYSSAGRNSS